MIGEKYGRLTVIKRVEPPEHLKDKRSAYYLCECECGNTKIVQKQSLKYGKTISCGCYQKEILSEKGGNATHNLSKSRFYRIWSCMKRRCTDPNYNEYHRYGGANIKICDEWLTFENFMHDMYESYLAFEKENGEGSATLDRIDPDGDYTKDNCRWATQLEQARNRRDNISVVVDGVEYKTLTELAETYNIDYQLVAHRYRRGKRGLELVAEKKFTHNGTKYKAIEVEVNGKVYESLTALQKDYPYISRVTLTKRFKKGLRGTDLIQPPKNGSKARVDQ